MARGPGKGKTNNPNGRPKGVPNKSTTAARETFNKIIEGQIKNIEESLKKIKEEDHYKYLTILERLMAYVLPRKKDVTSDEKSIAPIINITEVRSEEE